MTAQRTQLHVELFGLHLIFTLLVLVAYASGAPCKHANGSLLHDGDGYISDERFVMKCEELKNGFRFYVAACLTFWYQEVEVGESLKFDGKTFYCEDKGNELVELRIV
ncbi:hypothetical protein Q1695_003986 [Nippostrongylus brasiliensis]|nr:hypothetical protein Q1695_003986 [Nippostrongylus brasiliensis]